MIAASLGLTSCYSVAVGAGEEAVLIYQPYFFGHGGVDYEPVRSGQTWCAPTTDYVLVSVVPETHNEVLEDVISNENTPLDFRTQIILQVKQGKSPILIDNYGFDWYDHNIKEVYNKMTRNHISQYSPFDLMSNREILDSIDAKIKVDMEAYIAGLSKEREFPIIVVNVITGRAIPNKPQLDEMNNTAAYTQAKQSQERRVEMEQAREAAERQRAIADKAYQNEMGMSTAQFLQLRQLEVIEKSNNPNINVLFGAGADTKVWHVN